MASMLETINYEGRHDGSAIRGVAYALLCEALAAGVVLVGFLAFRGCL